MRSRTPRNFTVFICVAGLLAIAIHAYLDKREVSRVVKETVPFGVTNDVVALRCSWGVYITTNAKLAAELRQSPSTSLVVTARERRRGGQVVGWSGIEFTVPKAAD